MCSAVEACALRASALVIMCMWVVLTRSLQPHCLFPAAAHAAAGRRALCQPQALLKGLRLWWPGRRPGEGPAAPQQMAQRCSPDSRPACAHPRCPAGPTPIAPSDHPHPHLPPSRPPIRLRGPALQGGRSTCRRCWPRSSRAPPAAGSSGACRLPPAGRAAPASASTACTSAASRCATATSPSCDCRPGGTQLISN